MPDAIPEPVENKSDRIQTKQQKENTASSRQLFSQVQRSDPKVTKHTIPDNYGNSNTQANKQRTLRQQRVNQLQRSRYGRVSSSQSNSRSIRNRVSHHKNKAGRIVTEKEIKRQYLKQKIADADRAVNKGGFKVHSKMNSWNPKFHGNYGLNNIKINSPGSFGKSRFKGFSRKMKKMKFKGF